MKLKNSMHKKFLISIFLIFVVVIGMSIFINLRLLEQYFLYKEKQSVTQIANYVIENNDFTYKEITKIEKQENVVIVVINNFNDIEKVNKELHSELALKGIILEKYWLWIEDYKNIIKDNVELKTYPQPNLKYNFLAEYHFVNDNIVLIGRIVPMNDQTLLLASNITSFILVMTGLTLFFVISRLVYRIIKPISQIREVTKAISNADFQTIKINTNDELELLADDISNMSVNLQKSYNMLNQKNQQMSDLISNVFHDLKTPISLIKMYSSGIKDGLDDGSFLDTIILQNNFMADTVEKLLQLAKVESQQSIFESINISDIIKQILEDFKISFITHNYSINTNIMDDVVINCNQDSARLLITNIVSNAIKYTADGIIKIQLIKEKDNAVFSVCNKFSANANIDTTKIWDAFYVAESSRNSQLSGTGLGLAIVSAICKQEKIQHNCKIINDTITFSFYFVK